MFEVLVSRVKWLKRPPLAHVSVTTPSRATGAVVAESADALAPHSEKASVF